MLNFGVGGRDRLAAGIRIRAIFSKVAGGFFGNILGFEGAMAFMGRDRMHDRRHALPAEYHDAEKSRLEQVMITYNAYQYMVFRGKVTGPHYGG